ncbi:MAG: aminopeptidase [Pseudomonadota bacterium]
MVFLIRNTLLSMSLFALTGCQLGYIAESAFYQAKLMRARVPLKYALENYKLNENQRKKIELAIELRSFMNRDLGLDTDSNYSRYVHLDRDYVTYAVNAAPKDELKQYKWHFPILGSVPYKGYFKKQSAVEEEKELKKKGLDTHLRGVSAYSTLGWFEDPLLSSMLRMKEHHFVNTLIHETVHANLYIAGKSKFNERIATFLGQLGAEAYYKKKNRIEELNKIVSDETHDELMFSEFITRELAVLRKWYKANKGNSELLTLREKEFSKMQSRFEKDTLTKMKTKQYSWFPKRKLNNAFLLLLELYNSDFSTLEVIANKHNRDFETMFQILKKLESEEFPEKKLREMAQQISSKS